MRKKARKQIALAAALLVLGAVLPLILIKTGFDHDIFIFALELIAFAGMAGLFLANDYKFPKH